MVLVVAAPGGAARIGADGAGSAASCERGAMGLDGEGSRYVVSGTDGKAVVIAAR